jgi:hypothetical protein
MSTAQLKWLGQVIALAATAAGLYQEGRRRGWL